MPKSAEISFSGFDAIEKHPAESMAGLVEKWLDNPLSRSILRLCAARDNCGRRVELALRKYAGEDVRLCTKCSAAYYIIERILDSILSMSRLERSRIQRHPQTPCGGRDLHQSLRA